MAGGHADWFGKPVLHTKDSSSGVAENTPPGQFAGSFLAKEFEKLTGTKYN